MDELSGGTPTADLHPKNMAMLVEGLSQTSVYVYMFDRDARFLYISPSAARSLGVPAEHLVGRRVDGLEQEDRVLTMVMGKMFQVLDSRTPIRGELTAPWGGATDYYEFDAIPVFNGDEEPVAVMAVVRDISEQRRYQNFLEILDKVNLVINSPQGVPDILSKIVPLIRGALSEDALAIVVKDDGKWTLNHSYPLLEPVSEFEDLDPEAKRLVEHILSASVPERVDDAHDDPRVDARFAKTYGIRSAMVIHLMLGGRCEGALTFSRSRYQPFSDQELDLGGKLATSLALAISNNRVHREVVRSEAEKSELLVKLAHERDLIRTFLESVPVAVALFEGDDPILVTCNQAFRDGLRVPPDFGPVEGRRYREMVTEEEFRRGLAMGEQVRKERRPVVIDEYRRVDPGGAERVYKISISPIVDGTDYKYVVASVNVTELVKAREHIARLAEGAEEERKRLRTILDTLPVGVMIVDKNGNIVESNEYRDRIWGGPASVNLLSQDLVRFKGRWAETGLKVAPKDWPIWRALHKGETITGEIIDIQRFDGVMGTELVSAAPIIDQSGERVGAVGVVLDITQQRRAEQEALEAKATAEFYLDLLTHDINNINTVVSSNLQLILEQKEAAKRKKSLEAAIKAVDNATKLVETVKKIQRVEAQEDNHSLVDLGGVLEEVREDMEHAYRDRAKIEYQPHLKRYVIANALLKDLFTNLVENAIKHSEDKVNVTISVLKAFEGAKEQYKVIIEDDGPGIPDDIKSKVFAQRFRGKTSSGGSGLGLFLVRRLTDEFHGRVWVEDRVPGDHTKGARFVVMLPVATSLVR